MGWFLGVGEYVRVLGSRDHVQPSRHTYSYTTIGERTTEFPEREVTDRAAFHVTTRTYHVIPRQPPKER
jgi:hypothetical protein